MATNWQCDLFGHWFRLGNKCVRCGKKCEEQEVIFATRERIKLLHSIEELLGYGEGGNKKW